MTALAHSASVPRTTAAQALAALWRAFGGDPAALDRAELTGTDPNDGNGIGIGVEADAAVTGNVIENAPTAGISVGWGQYLRDVSVTGNVVRSAGVGIAVSVTPGAGSAVIADNLISGTKNGAIVGMDQRRTMTGDLARDGAARYAQLAINGNRVR